MHVPLAETLSRDDAPAVPPTNASGVDPLTSDVPAEVLALLDEGDDALIFGLEDFPDIDGTGGSTEEPAPEAAEWPASRRSP